MVHLCGDVFKKLMYNRKEYENDVNRDAISDFKTKQPIPYPHNVNVK